MRIPLLLLAALAVRGQTLDQLLSSPFPTNLTASGNHVAWVANTMGVRNVWADGRQITAYTEDDGEEISQLIWNRAGDRLVYVRGRVPVIWRVAVNGGPPERIAGGNSVAYSPDGSKLAWLDGGQLHWTNPTPMAIAAVRGTVTSFVWSPDGRKIALVNSRGDHAFIGVFDGTATRFPDPSFDTDSAPAWSPDSTTVAWLRMPASKPNYLFLTRREGEPFSIRAADVGTARGREIWRADRGRGSVFQAVVGPQLIWGADGNLVFPWEKDGWTHLYSVSLGGGKAKLLTPGAFEVEYVAAAPGAAHVVFNSNQGDIDRRHIWRVPVAGGPVQSVTNGKGIEWSPTVLDGGVIAYLASDARRPAHVVVGAKKYFDTDFPADSLVEPQAVEITATDGMKAPAQLFLPKTSGPHPAVIFVHGGPPRQMLLGWNYSLYYHSAYALNQYLATRGYVVLSLNYRSGIGYGREFREALARGASGASEFQDVLGAGLYLKGRADVDPKRIGIWGGSYGGYLTAMALSRASDLFAAGVDIHGVHDWNNVIRNFVPSYNRLAEPELAKLAWESSPLSSMSGWRSPVLVIHGDDDRNVPFNESVLLIQALRRQGIDPEQLVIPDEIHSFLRHSSWKAVLSATAEFFDRKFKSAPANPSTR